MDVCKAASERISLAKVTSKRNGFHGLDVMDYVQKHLTCVSQSEGFITMDTVEAKTIEKYYRRSPSAPLIRHQLHDQIEFGYSRPSANRSSVVDFRGIRVTGPTQ